jgi:ribulose-phosphate 3-epimerase
LLSADFANLQSEVEMLNESEAAWIHLDVMDGVFVPNISVGLPVCDAVKKHAKKFIDVHLMIVQPEKYTDAFKNCGADSITVHYEACTHLHRTLQQIKAAGVMCGVALNPHTSVELLEDCLEEIDLVCLMSVNPGFGGQKFIERCYAKIEKLRNMAEKRNPKLLIEVDGGVTNKNARQLSQAGANVLVAGSFVFQSPEPKKTIAELVGLIS